MRKAVLEKVTVVKLRGIGKLAKKAGVSSRFLLYVSRGERKMSPKTAAKLAKLGFRVPA